MHPGLLQVPKSLCYGFDGMAHRPAAQNGSKECLKVQVLGFMI